MMTLLPLRQRAARSRALQQRACRHVAAAASAEPCAARGVLRAMLLIHANRASSSASAMRLLRSSATRHAPMPRRAWRSSSAHACMRAGARRCMHGPCKSKHAAATVRGAAAAPALQRGGRKRFN